MTTRVKDTLILKTVFSTHLQVIKTFQRNEQLILGLSMVYKEQGQYFQSTNILLTITTLHKSSDNQ